MSFYFAKEQYFFFFQHKKVKNCKKEAKFQPLLITHFWRFSNCLLTKRIQNVRTLKFNFKINVFYIIKNRKRFYKESDCIFFSLPYLETSAATGQNVSRAVETLLDKVMIRMESAVDRAMLPGRRGRPKDLNEADLNTAPASSCSCWYLNVPSNFNSIKKRVLNCQMNLHHINKNWFLFHNNYSILTIHSNLLKFSTLNDKYL